MIIYHGHPSPNSIESARQAAPSHTHGAEWSPAKMTPHDWPYILDNGAFSAYTNSLPWDVDGFVNRLMEIDEKMPREPDFVVLPDVVTDSDGTLKRSEIWARLINKLGYRSALAVQDGMGVSDVLDPIEAWDIDAIFVGGTTEWKRSYARDFVEAADEYGLQSHIGRPGNLKWAKSIGADSVDTTTIVHNQDWRRLEILEEQRTLPFEPPTPARTDGGPP